MGRLSFPGRAASAAAVWALAAIWAPGAAAQTAPTAANYSSHAAGFFSELLRGRVWVLERPNARRAADRGMAWAHYHAPDGSLAACAFLDGARTAEIARWRAVPSRAFRALYNYVPPGGEPDPGRRRGHVPVFYDPQSGALHAESLDGGAWTVASRGWVQESWPRAMKAACPDLALPADLPVNERQTSPVFATLIAQDPDAALRGFPGSELRGPGATGIAASRGAPALTAAALARFLAANDGHVLIDNAGARHVLVLDARGDELWLLGGDGGVVDTARLVPASDGGGIALHYERLPVRPRFRVGTALPLLPTGERFAAMRLTDRLAARGEAVALPWRGGAEMSFRFAADGSVSASPAGGGAGAPGSWRWTRGELSAVLDGDAGSGSWPWREFARHAGGGGE